MSEMTLEQVRDWHREQARNIRAGITTGSAETHSLLADAIDAALQSRAQGQAVGRHFVWVAERMVNVIDTSDLRHLMKDDQDALCGLRNELDAAVSKYCTAPPAAAVPDAYAAGYARGHVATAAEQPPFYAAIGEAPETWKRPNPQFSGTFAKQVNKRAVPEAALATPAEPSIPVSKVGRMLEIAILGAHTVVTLGAAKELADRILAEYAGAGK